MINVTNCKKILGRAYNGANGKKIAVEYNGREYMLSCISEHIASSIFNMVGIKAQETMLGTYEVSGKMKVVCACWDFTEVVLGHPLEISRGISYYEISCFKEKHIHDVERKL